MWKDKEIIEKKEKKEINGTLNEYKILYYKIKELEDINFILNQKVVVYEHILKFLLHSNSWTQTLLSYLIDDEKKESLENATKSNFVFANDLISLPYNMVKFVKENTQTYQKKLSAEHRNINLSFVEPKFNLFDLNEKLLHLNFLNKEIPKKIKQEIKYEFSEEFLNDLDHLFKKHGILLNKNQFLHSIDASKLIFSLLRDVFIRIPYSITDFNPNDIVKSLKSVKEFIQSNFSKFTVKIWNQSFFLEPYVYIRPFEQSFLDSCKYIVQNFDKFELLVKARRSEIEVYSKKVDLMCFDKFNSLIEEKKIRLDDLKLDLNKSKPNLNQSKRNNDDTIIDFDCDSKIVQELLLLTNVCLSLPENYTHFDHIKQHYLTENWYLKKFINVLLVNMSLMDNFLDPDKQNVFNPLRLLLGNKNRI